MDRIYKFGNNTTITVPNGRYLKPSEIRTYESRYGKLYSVKFRGQTVLAD